MSDCACVPLLASLDTRFYILRLIELSGNNSNNVPARQDGRALFQCRPCHIDHEIVMLGKTTLLGKATLTVTQRHQELATFSPIIVKIHTDMIGQTAHGNQNYTTSESAPNTAEQHRHKIAWVQQIVQQTIIDALGRINETSEAISNAQRVYQQFMVDELHHYVIVIDLVCLNHDGNLLDTAILAAYRILEQIRIPEDAEYDEETGQVYGDNECTQKLVFRHCPLPLSIALVETYLLPDPTMIEEANADNLITVVLNERSHICGLHMPGGSIISDAQLKECLVLAKNRIPELQAALSKNDEKMQTN